MARRLVCKPNMLEQRTSTGADATGQPVGAEKARAPRPIIKAGQNEATKMLADNVLNRSSRQQRMTVL
jgi:hypothetical protein